jgi:two-component system, cell cycle sensor histidine kinase and response regulator CckA
MAARGPRSGDKSYDDDQDDARRDGAVPTAERQAAEYLATAVDSLDARMCLLDTDGRILWVNEPWRRFAADHGGAPSRCNEGAHYLAACDAAPATDPEAASAAAIAAALRRTLRGDDDGFEAEYACPLANGPAWFRAHARAVLSPQGRRVVLAHEDITIKKRAEDERAALVRQVLRMQRADAMVALSGRLAHDFNNILTAIFGNLELIRLHVPDDSPLAPLLDEIGQASDRASALVREIGTFRRDGVSDRLPRAIGPVIEHVATKLREVLPATTRLDLAVAAVPPLPLDAAQLQQALLKLGQHAVRNSKRPVRRLAIDVAEHSLTAAEAEARPGLLSGPHVRVRVRDDGSGITKEALPHLFDPYFSPRDGARGDGIGLAVAMAVARNHDGTIEVRSDADTGGGTEFSLWLPMVAPDSPVPIGPRTEPRRGQGHVLVVDDEVAITAVVARNLRRLGYEVTTCGSVSAGLLALATDTPFDAIVTDHELADDSGLELIRRSARPNLAPRVVLCTGHLEPAVRARAEALGVRRFLLKPFETGELSAAIAAIRAAR